MNILALDIATTTGVCVGTSGAAPRAWSVDLGKAPDDRRFSEALRMTQELIQANKPDLVVVEAAIGGPKASAYLIGLVACVRGVCWNRGVKCEEVRLASIRKHFLGKNLTVRQYPHLKPAAAKRAIKLEVVKRCALLGWSPDSDDEADAMAAWDYAQAHFAGHQAKPLGELFG